MGNVVFVIAQSGFRDEELNVPKQVLANEGHKCTVSSITTDKATGKLGMIIKPDVAVKDVFIDNYDALVIVGGPGCPSLMEYPEVLKLIQDASNKDKIVSSICLAGMILARAGVTQGKKATVFKTSDSLSEYSKTNTIFVDQPVVVDDTLVTANGPQAAEDFGKVIAKLL